MIARGRKGPGSMASRDSCASLPSWFNRQGACRSFCIQCNVLSPLPVGGNRHTVIASLQLSATDVSARTTMKGAAKCDKHCDLQNSVNQQGFERILRFRDTPESMPASVSSSVSCFWWILRPQGLESVCQLPVSVHQGASALDASSACSCCR